MGCKLSVTDIKQPLRWATMMKYRSIKNVVCSDPDLLCVGQIISISLEINAVTVNTLSHNMYPFMACILHSLLQHI